MSDFIEELLVFMGVNAAVDSRTEGSNNRISLDNFIVQAEKVDILRPKPNCEYNERGFFGNKTFTANEKNISNVYLELYDYLIEKKIIKKKVQLTFYPTYTINADLIDESNLKRLININNADIPSSVKCYNIHYNKLSQLLKRYDYSIIYQFRNIGKAGKKIGKNGKNKKSCSIQET